MKKFLLPLVALLVLASCANHGKKVSKDYLEIYYKDGATKEQAEKLLDYLYPKWKDNGEDTKRKSVQLTKSGDTINFRMVADMDAANKLGDEIFQNMSSVYSQLVFNGAPVNVVLTDDKFKTVRTYTFKKAEPVAVDSPSVEYESADGFGQKFESGNAQVYASGPTDEESQKLAAYLENYFKPATTFAFQFVKDKSDGAYTVRMVANPDKINTLGKDFFIPVSKGISDLLGVPSLQFELTDNKFNTLEVFKYPGDAEAQ